MTGSGEPTQKRPGIVVTSSQPVKAARYVVGFLRARNVYAGNIKSQPIVENLAHAIVWAETHRVKSPTIYVTSTVYY